jgi:protein FrlC
MEVVGDTISGYFEASATRSGTSTSLTASRALGSGHLAAGDGSLPLGAYLEELERRDYRGFLTLEALNARYLRDPDAALHQSVTVLRQHLT